MVKILFSTVFFLFFLSAGSVRASSGIEEQRKYKFSDGVSAAQFQEFLNKPLENFRFFQHSTYSTDDIYFDSEDLQILKSSLSFRLRRVQKKSKSYEYALQLKSEMTDHASARMEIEYKDFSFQSFENKPVHLWIDEFIEQASKRKIIGEKLSQWLLWKADSTLPPLQELKKRNLHKLKFFPLVLGQAQRLRFHVFQENVKKSKKSEKFLDDFFKNHPTAVWFFEGSFDRAHYFPVTAKTFVQAKKNSNETKGTPQEVWISELEMENKFRPRSAGTHRLNEFENLIRTHWGAQSSSDSKYLQSMKALFPSGLESFKEGPSQ